MIKFLYISLLLFPITSSFSSEWITYTKENTDLPSNNILAVVVDGSGEKWFGTEAGLVHYNGENWKTYSIDLGDNLADNYINDLKFETKENNSFLWLATQNGVTLMDITNPESPTISNPYNTENSDLINDTVRAVTVDPGNVSWFGTFSGLSSLIEDIWGTYTKENFWIDHNKVVSLDSGPDSMVYICTDGGGIERLKMESVDAITSASALTTTWTGFYEPDSGKLLSNNVYSVFIEQNGNQWFGTDSGVALHTSYNTLRDWKNYTSVDGLIDDFVQSICKEKENIFWFGTPEGVSKFSGNSWTNYTSNDGLVHNNVRDIAIDDEGDIWFATEGGISVLRTTTSIVDEQPISKPVYYGLRNYPNPFNMQTKILFTLSHASYVELDIYNINGQLIASLANENREAGNISYSWNGLCSNGSEVPTGVYFVKFTAGKQMNTHKILVVK